MFDEETQDALSSLSEEDLTKVSFMIKKLAKKRQPTQSNRSDAQDFSVQKKQ